jgi:CsoR family transcriptional regulator, copper-sensing transcriptional repressor
VEGLTSRQQDFASLVPRERKAAITRRISLIIGQVHGLQRMIEENRTCPQVLVQVSAVREALRRVGLLLVENYLENRLMTPDGFGPPLSAEELNTMAVQLNADE